MPNYQALDGARLHYDLINDGADDAFPVIVLSGGGSRHPSYLGDLAGLSSRHALAIPHLNVPSSLGIRQAPDLRWPMQSSIPNTWLA